MKQQRGTKNTSITPQHEDKHTHPVHERKTNIFKRDPNKTALKWRNSNLLFLLWLKSLSTDFLPFTWSIFIHFASVQGLDPQVGRAGRPHQKTSPRRLFNQLLTTRIHVDFSEATSSVCSNNYSSKWGSQVTWLVCRGWRRTSWTDFQTRDVCLCTIFWVKLLSQPRRQNRCKCVILLSVYLKSNTANTSRNLIGRKGHVMPWISSAKTTLCSFKLST